MSKTQPLQDGAGQTGGLLTTVLIATAAAMAAPVISFFAAEDFVLDESAAQSRNDLAAHAEEVVRGYTEDADLERLVERLAGDTGCRITVLRQGAVVADSALDAPDFASFAIDVEAPPLGQDHFDTTDERLTFVRTLEDGTVVRVARVALARQAHAHARRSVRQLLTTGSAIALVMGIILAFALTRMLVRPARELTVVADRLAAGDLSARVRSQRRDELGAIGDAIDRLAQQVQDRELSLREQEDRLVTILDSMVEGVFVTNDDGTIDLTNDALDEMVEVDETLGRAVIEVIRQAELHQAVLDVSEGAEGREVAFEHVVDDVPRHFVAQVARLEEGRGAIGVLHDVTRRTIAERVRRDFVANASHELRTPITAIRGYAETLMDVDDVDMRARFLGVILRHARRLETLVDDMVALSRAESEQGAMNLQPVDLAAAVREVVEGLAANASAKEISVQTEGLDGLPNALAHPQGVDQVLINLIDNAIKYAPESGNIVVRAEQVEAGVCVSVTNDGPGVPAKHLGRVFERFYRVDEGRSREVGGTGLGLSIVKHLVARMNGEISVTSKPGETRFSVVWPRA